MAIVLVGSLIAEQTLTPSHARSDATGSDRFFLLGVAAETPGSITVTTVTYGGQSLTELTGASINVTNGSDYNYASIWYATAAQIALMNSDSISVTWSGALDRDPAFHHTFVSGVDQSSPFVDTDEGGNTASAVIATAAALTTENGGYVFAVAGNGSAHTWTWTAPLNELSDVLLSGGGFNCSSTSAGVATTGSNVTVEATASGIPSRAVIAAVSLRPAPAAPTFANPFGLLGVGRAA